MDFKFFTLFLLSFTFTFKATTQPAPLETPAAPSSVDNPNSLEAPAAPSLVDNPNSALAIDDYVPPPPEKSEVEGPENKDEKDSRGTIIRWLCYVFVTICSSLCICFCKRKPKTLRHNRFVTALIIIIDILCWILNAILASMGIPLIPYIPWWMDEDEIPVVLPNPPNPTADPPNPTADPPNPTAVTPQRSPIYDWLRLPRKATACPVCKGTAADFYVPNHCSHCGIGSSRVNCSAAQVLERSGFAHT